MGWFGGKTVYKKSDAMSAASLAAGKGNRKKAIAEYKKILEHEPENAEVQGKVAVLFAESNQLVDAWKHFVASAEAYKKRGFDEKALALYVNAAGYMPQEVELWLTISSMHLKKNRTAEAIKTLLQGRTHFRKKALREFAIRLLKRACEIEPWHFEATFDLAGLLASDGSVPQARKLYEGLSERVRNKKLRKVRGRLFRLSPSPGAGWRWLRAATRGR